MSYAPDPNKPDTGHAGAEPLLWHLERVEALAEVLGSEPCQHCRTKLESPAGPGMAVEVIHEPGCPALLAAENLPSVIGYPYPGDPRTPLL